MKSRPSKALFACAALLLCAVPASAQRPEPSQEELVAKRDEKLKSPFLQKAPWIVDWDAARAEAAKSGKPIFAYFTRSYAKWGPCDALEAAALSDAAFAEFGKKVVLFCHVTSRVADAKYDGLLKEKEGRGFPYLVFMDAEGKLLGSPKGRTVEAFETFVAAHARIPTLKAKAAKGDKAAAFDLVIEELSIGAKDFAAASAALKEVGPLSAAQKARWASVAYDAEAASIMSDVRKAASPEESKARSAEAAEKFLAMKKEGRIPVGDSAYGFWNLLFNKGCADKNKALAQEAFNGLEKVAEKNPGMKERVLPGLKKRLDEL